jgi:[ribosomal protein S5]-alanine N-acetyltransferase
VIERVRLSSARLVVRTRTSADAEECVRYNTDNKDHFAPWEPERPAEYYSVANWRERLARNDVEREAGRAVAFAVLRGEDETRFVGLIQMRNIVREPRHGAEIGYSIDRREEGKGLTTEAVGLVVRWAFDVLRLHRLEAGYSVENARSARVLAKLGFEVEGRQRAYLLIGGRWHDHVSTSLINDAWRPR